MQRDTFEAMAARSGSEHTSKPGESHHRLREALPEQDVEVPIDIDRRVLQLLSLPLRGGDHRGLVEIEEVSTNRSGC